MEAIYGLMEQLLKIDDELNAIGYVNRRMYEDIRKCEESNPTEISMMCVTEKYLTVLSSELKDGIKVLDEFILTKKQTV